MVKAIKTNFLAKIAGTIGLGLVIGLSGCQQKIAKQPAVLTDAGAQSSGQALPMPPNGQQFLQPTVPQLRPEQMPTLPIKGLTPATKPDSRLSQLSKLSLSKNTRDPFSVLGPGISIVPPVGSDARPVAGNKTKSVAKSKKVRSIAKSRIKPLKIAARPLNLQPAPVQMPVVPMSAPELPLSVEAMPNLPMPKVEPLEAAPLPPVSATSLADRVEISGVMQVGGKTMVIAKADNENSARYLQAGDSLAGGQVLVKSVRVSAAGEPIVILEQNGIEVTKSVGSSGSRVAALR